MEVAKSCGLHDICRQEIQSRHEFGSFWRSEVRGQGRSLVGRLVESPRSRSRSLPFTVEEIQLLFAASRPFHNSIHNPLHSACTPPKSLYHPVSQLHSPFFSAAARFAIARSRSAVSAPRLLTTAESAESGACSSSCGAPASMHRPARMQMIAS